MPFVDVPVIASVTGNVSFEVSSGPAIEIAWLRGPLMLAVPVPFARCSSPPSEGKPRHNSRYWLPTDRRA